MTCTTCQHLSGERCAKGYSRDDVPWECADYAPDCGGCNVIHAQHTELSDLRAQVEGLTAERDHYRVGMANIGADLDFAIKRAEKAEAEVRRMMEGVEKLLSEDWQRASVLAGPRIGAVILARVRALLEPTP